MVGEGDYISNYLNEKIILTGYVERDIYESILVRCDMIANLRYPSMGETSISLIHAMALGKTCLVTNNAWFSELPDKFVIKINQFNALEEVYNHILFYYRSKETLTIKQYDIKKYIQKNHSAQNVSANLYRYLVSCA